MSPELGVLGGAGEKDRKTTEAGAGLVRKGRKEKVSCEETEKPRWDRVRELRKWRWGWWEVKRRRTWVG